MCQLPLTPAPSGLDDDAAHLARRSLSSEQAWPLGKPDPVGAAIGRVRKCVNFVQVILVIVLLPVRVCLLVFGCECECSWLFFKLSRKKGAA